MTEGMQVKLKEAYNLLQGRAVFVEKRRRRRLQTDEIPTPHGYELANVLNKYPIRELADNDLRDVIVQALKSGERRLVTFLKPSGKTERKIIEANSALKTIHIFPVIKTTPQAIK